MERLTQIVCWIVFLAATGFAAAAQTDLKQLVAQYKFEEIQAKGPEILPALVSLYAQSSEDQRANIASIFYRLGWKSQEAKKVLMKDAHSQNQSLRISVQYALGRVSNDPDVVDVLLTNMQDDANPLFRDKAACALAYDQIHLTEKQKVRLFAGLIGALRDSKPQVRSIAIQALRIQTGQSKGYNPNGAESEREVKIRDWEKWLEEYRSNL